MLGTGLLALRQLRARKSRGTQMPNTKPSILIIDRSQTWGADLRDRLVPSNIRVHVVASSEAALALARAEKISAAIVEFDLDAWTSRLCTNLHELGIRTVYSGPASQVIDEAFNRESP
jgi:PleD family two-component response regulator